MLQSILGRVETALSAASAAAASEAFHAALAPLGVSYLQTRLYHRPAARLTSDSHWRAGGFVTRIARPAWPHSAGFDYVCFACNPLLDAIRAGRTRYRFGDFAPHADRRFGAYWEALSEAGIAEALCATSYGASRRVASLHLGFDRRTFAPGEAEAVQMAGLLLTERMMALAEDGDADGARAGAKAGAKTGFQTGDREGGARSLSPRERDALGFVADGKSDWEIAVILGVAESTARFHVDSARRKLGAVNRTHAVAKLAAAGLL